MKFPNQFIGGTSVGLAFGFRLGAALAEGRKVVNCTPIAGVGILLIVTGAATSQSGRFKS